MAKAFVKTHLIKALELMDPGFEGVHYAEITKYMINQLHCPMWSRTPENTVNRTINIDIKTNGINSIFESVERGTYRLRKLAFLKLKETKSPKKTAASNSIHDKQEHEAGKDNRNDDPNHRKKEINAIVEKELHEKGLIHFFFAYGHLHQSKKADVEKTYHELSRLLNKLNNYFCAAKKREMISSGDLQNMQAVLFRLLIMREEKESRFTKVDTQKPNKIQIHGEPRSIVLLGDTSRKSNEIFFVTIHILNTFQMLAKVFSSMSLEGFLS